MLFKPTGLLGGELASGKTKGKGKAHTCMLVVQRKVSVRSEVWFFGLMKGNPALSPVHGK